MADDELSEKATLFWELVEPRFAEPGVERSTMMGFPCVRRNGQFFATIERQTDDLVVKLPAERVAELVESGEGVPFAPAGRVFKEWVQLPEADEGRWRELLLEAEAFAATRPAKPTKAKQTR